MSVSSARERAPVIQAFVLEIRFVALALLLTALWGCGRTPLVHEDDRRLSRMLCEVGEQRVTLSPRFSYDLPGPLRHTPCGTVKSGFNYDKVRDIQSASASGSYRSNDLVVLASSRWITVEGLLDGKDEGALYAPEQFLQNKLALMDLTPSKARPEEIEWVTRQGMRCLRFYDIWHSPTDTWEEDVTYWCWENQSGLKQPFSVSAGQRLPEGTKGYDLDQAFILPFFQSLKINRLSDAALAEAEEKIKAACAHVKSRYDQHLNWGADYPDKRLTRQRLRSCGYDAP
ncbi:hypothetical protein PHLH5_47400 [Pseudomonas sp. Cab53]|nr:hypothetical protein PHLH5_47400 [Pseudomonas sp. Cab53]